MIHRAVRPGQVYGNKDALTSKLHPDNKQSHSIRYPKIQLQIENLNDAIIDNFNISKSNVLKTVLNLGDRDSTITPDLDIGISLSIFLSRRRYAQSLG